MEMIGRIPTKNCQCFQPWEEQAGKLSKDLPCPFFNFSKQSCRATKNVLPIAEGRRQLCNSDDHDSCPTYLAYLLRRSRPMRSDCDWLDVV